MTLTTREEYESEIARLQSAIIKAQKDYDYQRQLRDKSRSSCAGVRGWRAKGLTECDAMKIDSAKLWEKEKSSFNARIENAKDELWNYQKRIAQEEQDAQVEAVKRAIAEQVKAEQEKIIAQNQNSVIETPTIKNPIAQIQQEVIQPQTNNQNLILPVAVVAGVLLL